MIKFKNGTWQLWQNYKTTPTQNGMGYFPLTKHNPKISSSARNQACTGQQKYRIGQAFNGRIEAGSCSVLNYINDIDNCIYNVNNVFKS